MTQEAGIRSASARLAGIDVARFLAIVAMFGAHVGPTDRYGFLGRVFHFIDGLAPILFILVAGMGVTLLSRGRAGSMADARIRLVWTAAVLLFAGLWLQELDHGIAVILQHFTPLFLVGAALMTWRSATLLWLGALLMILGPVSFLYGLIHFPELYTREVTSVVTPVGEALYRIMATGSYPFTTYIGVFLVGMALAASDLGQAGLAQRFMLRGFALFVGTFLFVLALETFGIYAGGRADWTWLALTRSHSQMPLWVVSTTGFAVGLVGLCLFLVPRLGRLARPLVTAGQMALTLYVGQLLVFHFWPEAVRSRDLLVLAVWKTLALSAGAVLFAVVWRLRYKRGPLEALILLPWSVRRRRN